jgi:chemotaxis protein methyltransferase CheR
VAIRAVDLNPTVLAKARHAHFAPWALRETPAEVQRRWFHAKDRHLVLNDDVRTAVTFEARNLAVEDVDLWLPEHYDTVFCRNVMMYFSTEQATALVARIARSLMPGGYLFLGHAETLRGLSDAFHLRHTHGTFYYQRKEGHERTSAPHFVPRAVPATSPDHISDPVLAEAWFETIRQASARIEALVAPRGAAPQPRTPAPQTWDLSGALDLLRHERFTDALTHIRALPPDAAQDPDVLILEAMLRVHGSEFAVAAEICSRILVLDDLNAAAHYVLALCREGLGDHDGAVEHHRLAVHLDAGFAMPRLHLGLAARRSGDLALARRELGQAMSLLKHEDASRLLLFGGGFNRQALIALCEASMRSGDEVS